MCVFSPFHLQMKAYSKLQFTKSYSRPISPWNLTAGKLHLPYGSVKVDADNNVSWRDNFVSVCLSCLIVSSWLKTVYTCQYVAYTTHKNFGNFAFGFNFRMNLKCMIILTGELNLSCSKALIANRQMFDVSLLLAQLATLEQRHENKNSKNILVQL